MGQSWIRKVALLAVLAVGSVASAGTITAICGSCYLPGVDYCGCLDWSKGGCLKFTGCYDCKCHTLITVGRGTVTNCSGSAQCYKCSGLGQCVLNCLGYNGTTCVEKYEVSKGGCAVFTGGFKCVYPNAA